MSRTAKTLALRLALRITFGATLVFLSLREYLLGNGLFLYRDWSWPLSNKLTPVSSFSPEIIRNSTPDPFGFTRMFLNWPVVIFQAITGSPVIAEKLYVLYLYSVMVTLAYIFAELLLRLLNRHSNAPLSLRKGELFVAFVTLFSFANFWSLQQLSDLYYTYVIEFFLTSISIMIVLLWRTRLRAAFLTGAVISLGNFLAPEMYFFMLISVSTVFLVTALLERVSLQATTAALTKILAMFAVTLPSLLTMLFILSATIGTHVRTAITYQASSSNLSLDNAVRLLGYWWSLITYASPSILSSQNSVSSLPTVGSPPYMILSWNPLTVFWLAASWFLPVFALASSLIRRFRLVTIPTAFVAVLGILMTQPSIFPLPYIAATGMEGVPYVGGALATVFAVPDHILIMVASAYLILVGTGFYCILSSNRLGTIYFIPKGLAVSLAASLGHVRIGHIFQFLLVAGIGFLLIFPAWQFFSGSFYPSGYIDRGQGNGLSSIGSFSPAQPPTDMIAAYNWLADQPGTFNIYWPSSDVTNAYPWSQKVTPSVAAADSPQPAFLNSVMTPIRLNNGVRFLVESNLTADLATYLQALNIRYVVVQPLLEPAMLSVWGVPDTQALEKILANSPGITLALQEGSVSVYEVSGTWGPLYSPNLVAGYSSNDQRYTIAYSLLKGLGAKIAIVKPESTPDSLCFDRTSCTISVLSPAYLSSVLRPTLRYETLNFSTPTPQGLILQAGNTHWLPSPLDPWIVANWGHSDATVRIGQESMLWTFGGVTKLSLSYNGTVTNNHNQGVIVSQDAIAAAHVDFWYRTSTNFDSTLQVEIPALNRTGLWFATSTSDQFPASGTWQEAEFTATIPAGSVSFTPRIQTTASSGWVEIRNVDFRVGFLAVDHQSPFGTTLHLTPQTPISLGYPAGALHLQYRGLGSLALGNQSTELLDSTRLAWSNLTPPFNTSIGISGSLDVGTLIVTREAFSLAPYSSSERMPSGDSLSLSFSASVVLARMFAPGYSLTGPTGSYSPGQTLDGMNIFLRVEPGSYSSTFASDAMLRAAYFGALSITLAILLISCDILTILRKSRVTFSIKSRVLFRKLFGNELQTKRKPAHTS